MPGSPLVGEQRPRLHRHGSVGPACRGALRQPVRGRHAALAPAAGVPRRRSLRSRAHEGARVLPRPAHRADSDRRGAVHVRHAPRAGLFAVRQPRSHRADPQLRLPPRDAEDQRHPHQLPGRVLRGRQSGSGVLHERLRAAKRVLLPPGEAHALPPALHAARAVQGLGHRLGHLRRLGRRGRAADAAQQAVDEQRLRRPAVRTGGGPEDGAVQGPIESRVRGLPPARLWHQRRALCGRPLDHRDAAVRGPRRFCAPLREAVAGGRRPVAGLAGLRGCLPLAHHGFCEQLLLRRAAAKEAERGRPAGDAGRLRAQLCRGGARCAGQGWPWRCQVGCGHAEAEAVERGHTESAEESAGGASVHGAARRQGGRSSGADGSHGAGEEVVCRVQHLQPAPEGLLRADAGGGRAPARPQPGAPPSRPEHGARPHCSSGPPGCGRRAGAGPEHLRPPGALQGEAALSEGPWRRRGAAEAPGNL
mmetsp:Transcript_15011/g.56952  ORF Transcript_15011/g.56952 Transcript_15011/m.56952 type:complete len:476 (+) Transcript_15011:3947-5374(+)